MTSANIISLTPAAATVPETVDPSRVRTYLIREMADALDNMQINNRLAKMLSGSPQDPRFGFFMTTANFFAHMAFHYETAINRWSAAHDLPGAPKVRTSPGVQSALIDAFMPFGYPELMSLYNGIRKATSDFRDKVYGPSPLAGALADTREEILDLWERVVGCADQMLSRLKAIGADASDKESEFDPDYVRLPNHLYPQPNVDFPAGPHYSR